MANAKISELAALLGSDVASGDLLPVVDVSAGSAGSKKITVNEFLAGLYKNGITNRAGRDTPILKAPLALGLDVEHGNHLWTFTRTGSAMGKLPGISTLWTERGTNFPNFSAGSLMVHAALTGRISSPSNRDATQSGWAKTNCTAAKDQPGLITTDGLVGTASTASSLLATAGNATCFFAITIGAAARMFSVWVKRLVGTGTIEITVDGGSTYTDITALINSSTYTRVSLAISAANPSVGFRIVTDTDKIAFDCANVHDTITYAPEPCATTPSRGADNLIYTLPAALTAGKRYVLKFKGKSQDVGATGLTVSVRNSGASSLVTCSMRTSSVGTRAGAFSLLLTKASVNQVNAFNLGPLVAGDTEVDVEVEFGMMNLTLWVNGQLYAEYCPVEFFWNVSGISNGSGTLDATDIADLTEIRVTSGAGAGYIRNLELLEREVRTALTIEGDSIMAFSSLGFSYVAPIMGMFSKKDIVVRNFAVSGRRIDTGMLAEYATKSLITYTAYARQNIFYNELGTNDIANREPWASSADNAALAQDIIDDLDTIFEDHRTAGFQIAVQTILPRNGLFNNGIDEANFLIVANLINDWYDDELAAGRISYLVDLRLVANLQDPDNATYYLDGVHPTEAGYLLMKAAIYAELGAVL